MQAIHVHIGGRCRHNRRRHWFWFRQWFRGCAGDPAGIQRPCVTTRQFALIQRPGTRHGQGIGVNNLEGAAQAFLFRCQPIGHTGIADCFHPANAVWRRVIIVDQPVGQCTLNLRIHEIGLREWPRVWQSGRLFGKRRVRLNLRYWFSRGHIRLRITGRFSSRRQIRDRNRLAQLRFRGIFGRRLQHVRLHGCAIGISLLGQEILKIHSCHVVIVTEQVSHHIVAFRLEFSEKVFSRVLGKQVGHFHGQTLSRRLGDLRLGRGHFIFLADIGEQIVHQAVFGQDLCQLCGRLSFNIVVWLD